MNLAILRKGIFLTMLLFIASCSNSKTSSDLEISYQSEDLVVIKISDHVYQHISFLETQSFGKVACNGMIVTNNNEAVIFDTTINNDTSEKLIDFVENNLDAKIKGVISTHFHEDCIGGIEAFNNKNIPTYALEKTIDIAKSKNVSVPEIGFESVLTLNVGNQYVEARFFGEGHTQDNIIGYYPEENIMFGGCLIKELNATKGNLDDANVKAWSETVTRIKLTYPNAKLIIPGHGATGNKELMDYTIDLFQ
ncbi:MAG TPA: subclass B1 metallo-beta-lactamase [Flavobacterium sp.]|jgi:metallo-beta-lactamase class B|nr:subclass B1 metallo-beta-lactamase [Flavobacterium sp.]